LWLCEHAGATTVEDLINLSLVIWINHQRNAKEVIPSPQGAIIVSGMHIGDS
jgi:hypothetical protein